MVTKNMTFNTAWWVCNNINDSTITVLKVCFESVCKKTTIHQLTTMLSFSKNVLFPGHNHLLTTGADDPSL